MSRSRCGSPASSTSDQALAGFGDPTVIFIATLFVVGEALDSTGVTAWAGQQLIARGGTDRGRLLTVVCLLVAVLTALISVNGAVAALIPVVVVVATRAALSPSQMLMPLAFSAHAGSMLALTGTPVNIIVSDAAADAGARQFGYFEFALAGVPLLVGALVIIVAFGRRLLPRAHPGQPAAGPRRPHRRAARAVRAARRRARRHRARRDRGGRGAALAADRPAPLPGHGHPERRPRRARGAARPATPSRGHEETLRAGDTLLLSGTWEKLQQHTTGGSEVLVVDDPALLRRGVPLGRGAKRAIVILAAMVLLLATGIVPPAIAGLLAACAVVLTGVLTSTQAYRAVSWTTVVLVGRDDPAVDGLRVDRHRRRHREPAARPGRRRPRRGWRCSRVCVLTMLLGQLISNTATVLIMVPIAAVVAADLGASPLPFMMALGISGAASFLTPVATPANTMVLEPGGYRFDDYWKLGLPLLLLFLAVAVFWVPFVWPF